MTSGTGGPEFRPPNKERLSAWLAGQRWFGGKDRRFEVSSLQHLARLTDEPVASDIWLVEVTYDDGGQETYQVPLVRHHEWVQQLEHVHVADDDDARLYDALHDKSVTRAWLDGVRRAVDTPVVDERITFHALPEAAELPDASSLVMTAEQSNTSLVYGGKAILKVYRRIFPGPHPDIELHEVLTRAKSPYIAPLFGWVEGRWNEQGQEVSGALAMLQEFLPLATDGWQLALTSVLDLLGEEDLRADEVGGDFAAESERLGRATAHVHADIAEGLGTIEVTESDLELLARVLHSRLDAAVEAAPVLEEYADRLRAAYDAIGKVGSCPPLQRVHCDLHLGQVVRTLTGWVLLDFEGEPSAPVEERRRFDSPLRDIAGMLRSYDYAARRPLVDHPPEPQRTYRMREWATRNRNAFLDGYAEVATWDPRDNDVLLRAYETDKAVYEVVYESRMRPSWLPIPLDAVQRLAEGTAA